MIPSDLAARLRMLTEASFFDSEPPIQGPARIREIQARLPELLPGQQFTATLQRPLPDGTFQALVGGRTYTLALNHSAKSGDTLELVVTGKTPTAVTAQLVNPVLAGSAEASRPTLSQTGRLISFLLTGQPTPPSVSLAEGKPLVDTPPTAGNASSTLAPALREALTRSGLFYESHQVRWLAGQTTTAALLKEPQGQLSPRLAQLVQQAADAGAMGTAANPATPLTTNMAGAAATAAGLPSGLSGTLAGLLLGMGLTAPEGDAGGNPAGAGGNTPGANAPTANQRQPGSLAAGGPERGATVEEDAASLRDANQNAQQNRGPTVPERLMPLVHQQLDSMATQNYVLYGQAWPGQHFRWEIEDSPHERRGDAGDETAQTWNTTLTLTLPTLGGVEARLSLTPSGIGIRLLADDAESVALLDAARAQLDSALEAANLSLTGFVAEQRDGG